MDDIEPVSRAQRMRRVLRPSDELAVERDGERRPGAEGGKRVGDGRAFGQRERLLVDLYFHDRGRFGVLNAVDAIDAVDCLT
jgi:hypothetical protein